MRIPAPRWLLPGASIPPAVPPPLASRPRAPAAGPRHLGPPARCVRRPAFAACCALVRWLPSPPGSRTPCSRGRRQLTRPIRHALGQTHGQTRPRPRPAGRLVHTPAATRGPRRARAPEPKPPHLASRAHPFPRRACALGGPALLPQRAAGRLQLLGLELGDTHLHLTRPRARTPCRPPVGLEIRIRPAPAHCICCPQHVSFRNPGRMPGRMPGRLAHNTHAAPYQPSGPP